MKVFLDSIGCRLNQAEIERMAAQLRLAGHDIVNSPSEADLVIVNTCAVTSAAASDSRQKIRQAARSGGGRVIVTGCWSTLDPEAAGRLPGVNRIIPNLEKDRLVAEILDLPELVFDQEPLARVPLPGAHLRTRAFIKVQDGCDNFCTYCVTRLARGKGRSRSTIEVMRDIEAAAEGGAREIVLTGVHLGSWGRDLEKPSRLGTLIRSILAGSDIPRLRLSSLEPWDLDENFFALWQNQRLCRHLHMPLQSGSPTLLRRMARNTTPEEFSRLIRMAREVTPGMAVTTDVIAGFPGETEKEFEETLAFLWKIQFAAGHVFQFSPRPGTAAARMADPVPQQVKKQRGAALRAAFGEMAEEFRKQRIGEAADVLWEAAREEGETGWIIHGLTDNYIRVRAFSKEPRWNRIDRVRLDGLEGEEVKGTLLDPLEPDGTAWQA